MPQTIKHISRLLSHVLFVLVAGADMDPDQYTDECKGTDFRSVSKQLLIRKYSAVAYVWIIYSNVLGKLKYSDFVCFYCLLGEFLLSSLFDRI